MERFYASKPRDLELHAMYEQALASFWTSGEVGLSSLGGPARTAEDGR